MPKEAKGEEMKKVYIASPYTIGDVGANVANQMKVADTLIDYGFAPFVPLYSHFQHIMHPRPYHDWVKLDNEWVLACDIVLRLEGKSKGADAEVELAIKNNIPVYYELADMLRNENN